MRGDSGVMVMPSRAAAVKSAALGRLRGARTVWSAHGRQGRRTGGLRPRVLRRSLAPTLRRLGRLFGQVVRQIVRARARNERRLETSFNRLFGDHALGDVLARGQL